MIRYNLVKGRREDIQALAGQMKTYAYNTDSIRRKLRWKIRCDDQIDRRLNQISDRIEKNGRDLEHFGEKLQSIVYLYEQSEKRILGQAESDSFSLDIGGLIGGLVGKLGIAGPMSSMLVSWISGDAPGDLSDLLLDVGDFAVGTGNKIIKGIKKLSKEEWTTAAEWFGFCATNYTKDGNFIERFGANLKKEASESFEYMGDTGWSKALGIAGAVLNVAQTIKNNCDEYEKEEISEGRVALETVGELAADWAIGVGMTAVAATLLPVGAPAVAVGAAAAVATWALDQASELCFGKSASEAISDGIIDFGENVVQGIQSGKSVPEAVIDGVIDSGGKFVQGIQSGGEKVVQGMADWWGNLWNS